MDSDDADTPEINHHAFMAQLARQKEEKRRRHKERQKRAISDIKLTRFDGAVKAEEDKSNFLAVVGRLFGAIFFLSIGIGALVYSVAKSGTDPNFAHATTLPPKTVSPFMNCTATRGTFVYETCVNKSQKAATCVETELHTVSAQWFQDDKNKRLLLVQGKEGEDRFQKIFAYQKVLYTIKYNVQKAEPICTKSVNQSYSTFISNFGSSRMRYEHQLIMQDYNNTPVWVFSGANPKGKSVLRYTSTDYGRINYGWTGYPYDDEMNLNRYEYWFGTAMRPDAPDAAIFGLPADCGDATPQYVPPPRLKLKSLRFNRPHVADPV